jgi:Na+/melibiose symporter-like transporter
VASWQTFFATAGYVLTYVVAPILFDHFGVRGTIWMLVPVFLSFIGPIMVIKESSTVEGETTPGELHEQAADVPLWESVKLTLANRTFRIYMGSVAVFYFGLQFFLGGIAFMAADMMGLTDSQLGMMNAAAFAPVPIMLILFNWLSKKKGAKWAFRLSLLVFAFAMLLLSLIHL